MKKGNSDFINKHKKGCINAASVLMFIIIAGIVVCMTSCGKKDRQEVTEPSTTETEPATTEHPTTEASTEEAEEGYINPFTGEKTDTDYSGTRPYAIMLNTIRQALPQSGNSKADMYIEMTEEGGITRVLGFYNSLEGVDKIGTIRSTREYFLSWAMGFDAIVVHAGGDPWIFDKINRSGYTTLNCVGNAGIDAGSAFFRDDYRMHNVGLEHSLYTTGPNLLKIISDKNINTAHTRNDYTKFNFAKDGEGTPDGESAVNVKVTFSGYKNTSFKYNSDANDYSVDFWNEPYIDETNSENIRVKNVIILPVPNWTEKDSQGTVRQKYNMAGGTGYYISGGKYIKINWTKGDYNDDSQYGNAFVMTTMDGKPLEIAKGKTCICMMNEKYVPEIN